MHKVKGSDEEKEGGGRRLLTAQRESGGLLKLTCSVLYTIVLTPSAISV